jgi:hypothetical protein
MDAIEAQVLEPRVIGLSLIVAERSRILTFHGTYFARKGGFFFFLFHSSRVGGSAHWYGNRGLDRRKVYHDEFQEGGGAIVSRIPFIRGS